MKEYWFYNEMTNKYESVEVDDDVYSELKRMDWRDEKKRRVILENEIYFSQLDKSEEEIYENFSEFVRLSEDVQEKIAEKETYIQLNNAFSTLSFEEKNLIFLLFFYGKTEREAGEIFGISQKNLNKKKAKILCRLNKLLKKE